LQLNVPQAVAEVLKREGVEILLAYPVNRIIEAAAALDIRPVIVRQERTGLHMADAISRVTSGRKLGVFCMQFGPGTENSYGGIAQAYGESVPILVIPSGYPRKIYHVQPNYNAVASMGAITKRAEPVLLPNEVGNVMRRAFSALRNGRGGPVLVEIPNDVVRSDLTEALEYEPVAQARYGADPADVAAAARLLVSAQRPVIHAGQGVHYARAWPQLRRLAELLAAPVMTTLAGKSAFPENHPLALGAGGNAYPATVSSFLQKADVIFGIGCSFTETSYASAIPRSRRIIHATLDPDHLNKDVPATVALVGDAALVLDALIGEIEALLPGARDRSTVEAEIAATRREWLARWLPKLTSNATPLSPYRVIWDLLHTVDVANTIITHDAGSPRDQLSPFWSATAPLTYLGWGKTTQLGYGLGLAMGAKLALPDKLCVNVWGDAAIGFTGMDLETAVRERIPILSILLNNFSMAIEIPIMPISTEKYRSTDISGNYAEMARAFGGYGERISDPAEIVPAIRRGIEQTRTGRPALLEFLTAKETEISRP
jgi:thiamine pyrophosphate-dependent acetolactate synthase large subunit-like protein